MNGHRRAALTLHCLAESDRDWVLSRLHSPDRVRLAQLLEELHKLGIPSDESLLSEARKVTLPEPAPGRIHLATPGQMLGILGHEPAGLIAAVLRIEAWPWQPAFVARLDPAVREKVAGELQKDSSVSEKLAEALRGCIESRLSAGPEPRERPRRVRELAAWAKRGLHRGRQTLSGALARWVR